MSFCLSPEGTAPAPPLPPLEEAVGCDEVIPQLQVYFCESLLCSSTADPKQELSRVLCAIQISQLPVMLFLIPCPAVVVVCTDKNARCCRLEDGLCKNLQFIQCTLHLGTIAESCPFHTALQMISNKKQQNGIPMGDLLLCNFTLI